MITGTRSGLSTGGERRSLRLGNSAVWLVTRTRSSSCTAIDYLVVYNSGYAGARMIPYNTYTDRIPKTLIKVNQDDTRSSVFSGRVLCGGSLQTDSLTAPLGAFFSLAIPLSSPSSAASLPRPASGHAVHAPVGVDTLIHARRCVQRTLRRQ